MEYRAHSNFWLRAILSLLALTGLGLASFAASAACLPGESESIVEVTDPDTGQKYYRIECMPNGVGAAYSTGGSGSGSSNSSHLGTEGAGDGFSQNAGESNAGKKEPESGNPVVISTGNKIEEGVAPVH